MSGKWFCRKKSGLCPYKAIAEQVRNCAEWDPRDVICDKTCRHAVTAEEKKAERERLDFLKAEHPEMLHNSPKKSTAKDIIPSVMVVDRKSDPERTAAVAAVRLEIMKQQAAAAERIAAALEKIASTLGKGGGA